jgi:hypothetical protein
MIMHLLFRGKRVKTGFALAFFLGIYILVQAADGYRAVFASAEVDPAQTDRLILLADHKNGQLLSANEGPFRIVFPGEKRPARWVRQVQSILVNRPE